MELARLAVVTLFNSVWETALLALVTAVILRMVPDVNATTRYAAWCLTLACSLVCAVASAAACTVVVQNATAARAAGQYDTRIHAPAAHRKAAVREPVRQPRSSTAAVSAPVFALPRPSFTIPDFVATICFALWGLAALALVVRVCVNLLRLEQLKRDALPLPLAYRDQLAQWTRAEKGKRDVRLCITSGIDVPVAVGLFDSMILIPQHLLDELSPAEIDQIMLHELGHLRRADDWTNGLQRVIQALLFFNPAVSYIAQQLDLEREVACDDWVLRQTQSVRPYAQCLTKMAEVTAWPHRALAAPGVFVTRRGLSIRVERLLRAGRDVRTNLSLGATGCVAAAAILIFFLVRTVAPSYAFTPATIAQAQIPPVPAVPKIAITAHPKVPVPAPPAPQFKTKFIYIERSPQPVRKPTVLIVHGVHVHQPARTIKIPAIDVDVKEQRIAIPAPPQMPPNFGQDIAKEVNASMRAEGMGADYSGQDLRNHSFRAKSLTGTDFSRANLQGADFSAARISGADFSRANLQSANFSATRMTGCNFSGANVQGARFDDALITGCNFSNTTLGAAEGGAILRACKTACDLTNAKLNGADLRDIKVAAVDLRGADLAGADLSASTFTSVNFEGASLDGARLEGVTFINCSFSGVNMQHIDFSKSKIIHSR